MAEKTIFEKIIDREIPAEIVAEGSHYLAFRDINPQAPVHVLVIPKAKVRGMHEIHQLEPETLHGFMSGIRETARLLGLEESGYRVVFNTGKDAQQTVDYVHAHILGGRAMSWPPG
jgi:histidine triad (HIT) family protein